MLTIIATMEHELAGLRRELQRRRAAGDVSGGITQEQPPLRLHVVGVGRRRAEAEVKALLESRSRSRLTPGSATPSPSNMERGPGGEARDDAPERLLLLGFAGAVDPALRTGELSLSTRYYLVRSEVPPSPLSQRGARGDWDFLEPDGRMWRQAVEAIADAGLPSNQLDSLTSNHLVATPAAKLALRRQYPVGVVNMEDYWVAAAARDAGVPFLSVRAVLDSASQRLPVYLLGLAEHQAREVILAVVMPWRIPTLIRLARQVRLAQQNLTSFALSFINRWYGVDLLKLSPQ